MEPSQNPNPPVMPSSPMPQQPQGQGMQVPGVPGQQPSPQPQINPLGQPQQPSQAQPAPQHQVVQVVRPVSPAAPVIPEDIQRMADQSKTMYPNLNLSPGEFVIDSVQRHPIGLLKMWAVIGALVAAVAMLAFFFTSLAGGTGALVTGLAGNAMLFVGVICLAVLFILGGIVATYVYNNNRFYLTNESVVQEIMHTLFSRHVQTVSLGNIEDASYRQEGILPHLLNYGDIRLSTEGDETTYRFSYVSNPAQHIAKLNNAVEAFKNGRPVVND